MHALAIGGGGGGGGGQSVAKVSVKMMPIFLVNAIMRVTCLFGEHN